MHIFEEAETRLEWSSPWRCCQRQVLLHKEFHWKYEVLAGTGDGMITGAAVVAEAGAAAVIGAGARA
jgi:hypothetical protein